MDTAPVAGVPVALCCRHSLDITENTHAQSRHDAQPKTPHAGNKIARDVHVL